MMRAGKQSVYKIEIPKRVARQLDKILHKGYLFVSTVIHDLKEAPRPPGCEKLFESFYRIRIGDFRVIYWIDDENRPIVITKVAKRKESTHRSI